mgnify:CR=1 FL=1
MKFYGRGWGIESHKKSFNSILEVLGNISVFFLLYRVLKTRPDSVSLDHGASACSGLGYFCLQAGREKDMANITVNTCIGVSDMGNWNIRYYMIFEYEVVIG